METKDRKPMRTNPQGGNDFMANRSMAASFRALEDDDRSFELSFSSEEPVARWYGSEILSHDEKAVNLERIRQLGVVLFGHRTDSVDNVVGQVTKVWLEKGRGKAIIRFDDDEASEKVRKKVAGGTLRGVSVGYAVDAWEEVKPGKKSSDGRFTGPCYIAVRWSPLEISIVPVPADGTVGVGRSAEEEGGKPLTTTLNERQLQINQNLAKALAASKF